MANKKRRDPMSEAALEGIKREQEQKNLKDQQQELKEKSIANIYEMAGKIKGMKFLRTQSNFFGLVMLKQVKESKEYKEKFGMSWQKFCVYVGVDRRRIDEKLEDLKPFKANFLADFANFSGVELHKIKYLGEAVSGGFAKIEDNTIIYEGETIPLTPEHKDDVQALLERISEQIKAKAEEIKAQKKAFERVSQGHHKTITNMEKDLSKLEKEAKKKNLTKEEDAFLQQMQNLKIGFDGYMLRVDPERMEDLKKDSSPTVRMRVSYIEALGYMRRQILSAYDTAVETYGDPVMSPEDAWVQPGGVES